MFCRSPSSISAKGHQQLTSDQADEQDRIIAGVQFNVRYVGSTEVAGLNGTGSGKTEIPVAQVFNQQKQKGEPRIPRKMVMTLCSKSLSVSEESSGRLVANFPIAKISFCNVDTNYEKAFVFVARDSKEKPFKVFVFLCESKTKARDAFKALSLAFTINYESLQASRVREASNRAGARTSSSTSDEMKTDDLIAEESDNSAAVQDQGVKNRSPRDGMIGAVTPPTECPHNYLSSVCSPIRTPIQATIADNRVRSASTPYSSNNANRGGENIANRPCASIGGDDDFDAEFTQFAELRSRSKSDNVHQRNNGGFPSDAFQHGSDREALGRFKQPCLPML